MIGGMGDALKTPQNSSAAAEPSAVFGHGRTTDEERTKIVERFAQAYVQLGTWAGAYRRCYDCTHMTNASVWRESRAMSDFPGVRERVRELLAEGAQRAIITVAEVLRAQVEIASANPADVVRVSEHNCRHCHGVDGLYQWRDQDEFATACARELDLAAEMKRVPKMPSDAGGYGFTVHRRPSPECESCRGVGEPAVHITDSSLLTGPAAKLLKSVRQDRFGAITVELHDQQAAWDKIARILGAYKDGLTLTTPRAPDAPMAPITRENAAEQYLALVR